LLAPPAPDSVEKRLNTLNIPGRSVLGNYRQSSQNPSGSSFTLVRGVPVWRLLIDFDFANYLFTYITSPLATLSNA